MYGTLHTRPDGKHFVCLISAYNIPVGEVVLLSPLYNWENRCRKLSWQSHMTSKWRYKFVSKVWSFISFWNCLSLLSFSFIYIILVSHHSLHIFFFSYVCFKSRKTSNSLTGGMGVREASESLRKHSLTWVFWLSHH